MPPVPQTLAQFQALDNEDKRKVKGDLLTKYNGEFCNTLSPDIVNYLNMDPSHVELVQNAAKQDNDFKAVSLMLRKLTRTDKPWWKTFEKALQHKGYEELYLLLNPWEIQCNNTAASPSRAAYTRRHTGVAMSTNTVRPYSSATHLDSTRGIAPHLEQLDDWRSLADAVGFGLGKQRMLQNAAESGKGRSTTFFLDALCETFGPEATVGKLTSALLSLGVEGQTIVSKMERSGLIETVDRPSDGSGAGGAISDEEGCCGGTSTGTASAPLSCMLRSSQRGASYNSDLSAADGERLPRNVFAEPPKVAQTQETPTSEPTECSDTTATMASDGALRMSSAVRNNSEDPEEFESITDNAAAKPDAESVYNNIPEEKVNNLEKVELAKDIQNDKPVPSDNIVIHLSRPTPAIYKKSQKLSSGLATAVADQEEQLIKANSKLRISQSEKGRDDVSSCETNELTPCELPSEDCGQDGPHSEPERDECASGFGEEDNHRHSCGDGQHLRASVADTLHCTEPCKELEPASFCSRCSANDIAENKGQRTGAEKETLVVIQIGENNSFQNDCKKTRSRKTIFVREGGTCNVENEDNAASNDEREPETISSPGSFLQREDSFPLTSALDNEEKRTSPAPQSTLDLSDQPGPWEKEKHETCLKQVLLGSSDRKSPKLPAAAAQRPERVFRSKAVPVCMKARRGR
ncbi:uncharacterized protein LOC112564699 [Pomacea canaliculata]|uniref:uncharacterized protein LOC112564699 n=1 Tax=Pomacea canaliculata TaxID=400727 RepID=UPI000D72FCFD|nr:uncharacterized protein LOC112564699 [Pomacea canaliculata]